MCLFFVVCVCLLCVFVYPYVCFSVLWAHLPELNDMRMMMMMMMMMIPLPKVGASTLGNGLDLHPKWVAGNSSGTFRNFNDACLMKSTVSVLNVFLMLNLFSSASSNRFGVVCYTNFRFLYS